MPALYIRFDIDTSACLKKGVPSLLDFSSKLNVEFSFFINMGKAVDRSQLLRRFIKKKKTEEYACKLSAVDKLGIDGVLGALFLNRQVGVNGVDILKKIESAGHCLGLHGGKNHASWQNDALSWDVCKVREELAWGVSAMKAAGLSAPRFFSSPGWTSPECLRDILADYGMYWLADLHEPDLKMVIGGREDVSLLNTRGAAYPGGVGLLENLHAMKFNDHERKKIYTKLVGEGDDVMIYDHPAFSGKKEGLFFLQELIEFFIERGYQINTLKEMENP